MRVCEVDWFENVGWDGHYIWVWLIFSSDGIVFVALSVESNRSLGALGGSSAGVRSLQLGSEGLRAEAVR